MRQQFVCIIIVFQGKGQAVAHEITTHEAIWSFGEHHGCTMKQLEVACILVCENELNDLLKVMRTFLIYCCCKY